MRHLHLAGPVLAFLTAFAAYGCTLDVAGLSPGETSTSGMPSASSVGGAGPGGSSASSAQGGGGAGGAGGGSVASTSTSTSVASSTSTGCASAVEICDNGVDDNCDGPVDCADPQCMTATGRACVDAAPAGWALTAILPGMLATCPAGYDTPVAIAPPPTSAGATCDCTCGVPASNPCTQGSLTVKIGGGCMTATVTSNVTGGCDQLGGATGMHQSCGGTPLKAVTVSCGVTVTKPGQVAPATISTMCAPTPSAALGCGAGQACLQKAMSANVCIQASGDLACPAGSPFTARRLVGIPGDVQDNRACGACTCASNAATCSGATFTAYTDVACSQNAATATIDGTCSSAGAGQSFNNDLSFKYQATPNTLACTPSSAKPALTGQFDPGAPITICCKP